MLDRNEMNYFIEDIQGEEVVALLAVRISKFSGETLSGETPSHVATVTCNPPEGWSDSDRKRIDAALHDIADVLRARFTTEATESNTNSDVVGQNERIANCPRCEDGFKAVQRVVSRRHLELLEHTLGNETHYRNYFLASDGHHDSAELEELVEMGLMVKQDAPSWSCGDTPYHVTEEGKKLAFAR